MREKPELFLDNLRWVRSDPKYGDLGIVKFIMSLRNLEELGIKFTLREMLFRFYFANFLL